MAINMFKAVNVVNFDNELADYINTHIEEHPYSTRNRSGCIRFGMIRV